MLWGWAHTHTYLPLLKQGGVSICHEMIHLDRPPWMG